MPTPSSPDSLRRTVNNWTVYIIEACDGSLYTGITTDLQRRLAEHTRGSRGARYFRGREPRLFAFVESGHDRSSASRREAAIKRLNRREKLGLIGSADNELSGGAQYQSRANSCSLT